uniref:Terminase small subunit n=1 Tax=Myoviridae sp. ctQVY25 TaxID=2827687 RepID=A0A8S5SJI2_9CAUD|nr:MAG TPA: Terminase small subunit [Myoviridae sp. ctQVY25]DAW81369.1 MAG TPA: Terminase small subunit [Caudoviricetes sp.]
MKLNARQKSFCEFYVASGNATESAIKAGYSEKYTNKNVSKIRQNTAVQEYIKELQEKAKTNRIMTAVERREFLTEVIKNGNEKLQDRLKALDILNKMDSEYIEKMQLSGQVDTNPLSGLTTEELRTLAGGKNG